jgi:hypothetical protein
MFFLNDILTYYIADEEYECRPNLVLEHYVELKKGVF